MNVEDLEMFFGSIYRAAKEAGFSSSAPYHWRKQGFIPVKAQLVFEELTKGELVAEIPRKD